MTDLRAADQRARERALEVGRSFIVQAPAGSGKTELLTRRYLALLAVVEQPESVLAITFTRKAAAEMRNRIVGALRDAVRPPADVKPHYRRTLELARAVLAADAARGWGLPANPGRLRIQTIDALNLGLARRLPVLSGLGAGLGIAEDATELLELAAERLLEHLPDGEPRHAAAVATVLAHVDNRVQRFVALVVEMLMRRESWLPVLPGALEAGEDTTSLRATLETARGALVSAHLAELCRAFPRDLFAEAAAIAREAANALDAAAQDSPILAWLGNPELPTATLDATACWQGLASLLLTDAGTPRKRFDYKVGLMPGPQGKALKQRAEALATTLAADEELVGLLSDVRELPAPKYDAREWEVLEALLVVLRLAAAELELVFAERRAADYPRFAAAARQALGSEDAPTDTALALDATLRHVLVDEFQDTSEAQVSLLESLTAGWQEGDGRTLFLVGDPMQSVYRFRNAEVGLFLDIRDQGLGALRPEPLVLAVNFRSTRPVIDWINASFAQVLPPRDDVLSGAVSYAPCACPEDAAEEGSVTVHALFRRSRVYEAEQVAETVRRRLAEDATGRIGIIVQARNHLVNIVAELARRGIAFQATDIDPLAARPIVLDLLALTRAIAHAADRPAWLAVLRAPWCGLTLADLHALCADDRDATVAKLLGDPQRRERVAPEARARLERAWSVLASAPTELRRFGLRDAVERAWLALGGPATALSPAALDEAQAYLDELAELEARGRAGPVDLAVLATALEQLYAPSRPQSTTRVELLTIHKAKGLQFATVIVPGLDRRVSGDRHRLLQWTKLPGADHDNLVIAPLAGTGDEPNRLYAWLERLEREKLQQERRRLLYVAATRAETELHLFGSCRLADGGEGEPQAIIRPGAGVALAMLWPAVEPVFAHRLAEVGTIEGEPEPVIDRDPIVRRVPDDWRVPAPPVGPRIECRALAFAAAPTVEFDWATETARHVGTVVHRDLQRLARGEHAPHLAAVAPRQRYACELAELGVPADRRAAAVERVVAAVERTLADERGRWLLDASHRSAATELALAGPLDGEVVHVVIDRTFIAADGTRWIVDYKTSSHEGAGVDEFLASEQERYRPQLERYARLVRRLGPEPVRLGLYFPLLSAWREWS
ncbi:MAG: UvrD-helicase domain-containing protein [Steroidobacteraceae bacterium]